MHRPAYSLTAPWSREDNKAGAGRLSHPGEELAQEGWGWGSALRAWGQTPAQGFSRPPGFASPIHCVSG